MSGKFGPGPILSGVIAIAAMVASVPSNCAATTAARICTLVKVSMGIMPMAALCRPSSVGAEFPV